MYLFSEEISRSSWEIGCELDVVMVVDEGIDVPMVTVAF
jgi:hypothetical protein